MDHGVYTPCCDVIIIRILHRCNVTCSGRKHVLDKVDRDSASRKVVYIGLIIFPSLL